MFISRHLARPAALLAGVLLVAACGGAATTAPEPTAVPTPPSTASPAGPSTTPDANGATPAPVAVSPAPAVSLTQPWATAELTDVATGTPFTIAGFIAEGRPVILETMAIWCTNCLGQQQRIEEALGRTDGVDVAYIVVTVDPSEDAKKLARYREQNGFGGIYAVADRETARALTEEFGDQVLNPPATPVIAVSPSGKVTLTPFGPKSVDDIVALVEGLRS